jgi:hypothetical protein
MITLLGIVMHVRLVDERRLSWCVLIGRSWAVALLRSLVSDMRRRSSMGGRVGAVGVLIVRRVRWCSHLLMVRLRRRVWLMLLMLLLWLLVLLLVLVWVLVLLVLVRRVGLLIWWL